MEIYNGSCIYQIHSSFTQSLLAILATTTTGHHLTFDKLIFFQI